MRAFRTHVIMSVWLLLAAGCTDEASPAMTGSMGLGGACETSKDCASGLCEDITADRSVCTSTCTDPLGHDECPAGWRCRRPDNADELVCVCSPSGNVEVCGDEIDNDCDGRVDDCLMCNGRPVASNSLQHCGTCDTRCVPGSTCDNGECKCSADDPKDCVADEMDAACAKDADCDDGIPCTKDACATGSCVHRVDKSACAAGESCDPRFGGCTRGESCRSKPCGSDSDICTAAEFCDPRTFTCVYELLDNDHDGFAPPGCGGTDCDDSNAKASAGAAELCDGIDNDCDGKVDGKAASAACPKGSTCENGACKCEGSQLLCSVAGASQCIDVSSDTAHCGSCSVQCQAGFGCIDGKCTDIDECSESDDACPSGASCKNVSGTYQCICDPGYEPDSTKTSCVDIDECARNLDDCPHDCGNTDGGFECRCQAGYEGDGRACTDIDECESYTCAAHSKCVNSNGTFDCECDFGYGKDAGGDCVVVDECKAGVLADHMYCQGGCRDLLNDPANCHECGHACGANGICSNGACACSDAALTYCGDNVGAGCVNTQSNALHCKTCGHGCPAGAGCVAGNCVCPGGTVECGGSCITLNTNLNCASCGDDCPGFASCVAGSPGHCECPAGLPTVCNNTCVNTTNDAANCNTCGHGCPAGATCSGSACQCPVSAPDTCADTCVDKQGSELHCGTCGNTCAVICNAGACTTAVQVVAGDGFACARFADKRVACWGFNSTGQTGRGTVSNTNEAVGLVELSDVAQLVTRSSHVCALTSNGTLYCWGANAAQQYASDASTHAAPFQVRTAVSNVVTGAGYTCVVLGTGAIECLGNDAQGQHGDGAAVTASTTWSGPASLSSVDKLVSGSNHLCALKAGKVYCWGYNYDGQLGVGTSGSSANLTAPTEVPGLTGVDDIAAGYSHTCAVVDGAVYCWGLNSDLQCGGTNAADQPFPVQVVGVSTAVAVYAGGTHTCARLQDGTLTCWGSNARGEIAKDPITVVRSGTPQPLTTTGLTGIALGYQFSCGLKDSDLYCWGLSTGIAQTTDRITPTRITR